MVEAGQRYGKSPKVEDAGQMLPVTLAILIDRHTVTVQMSFWGVFVNRQHLGICPCSIYDSIIWAEQLVNLIWVFFQSSFRMLMTTTIMMLMVIVAALDSDVGFDCVMLRSRCEWASEQSNQTAATACNNNPLIMKRRRVIILSLGKSPLKTNIVRIANAVQVTLWLSVTYPQQC